MTADAPYYICRTCADGKGWTMPSDRISTMHTGRCGICGHHATLCATRNYTKPNTCPGEAKRILSNDLAQWSRH